VEGAHRVAGAGVAAADAVKGGVRAGAIEGADGGEAWRREELGGRDDLLGLARAGPGELDQRAAGGFVVLDDQVVRAGRIERGGRGDLGRSLVLPARDQEFAVEEDAGPVVAAEEDGVGFVEAWLELPRPPDGEVVDGQPAAGRACAVEAVPKPEFTTEAPRSRRINP
jgi:hypothetical protein